MDNKAGGGATSSSCNASGADANERGDERLRLVLQAAAAGIWEVDLRTGAVTVSKEQLAPHGLPPGSPFGFAEWIACVHPADRDRVESERHAALDAGTPYGSEFRIIRADTCEVRWIQGRGRRVVGADGRADVFVGVNLDITAAKQAEAELLEQFARLRATHEVAPVGLCLLDRHLRYSMVNARLAEMNGLPIEAHIGRTLGDVVPWVADQVEPIYRHVLRTGEPVDGVVCRGTSAAHPHEEREWLVNYQPVRGSGGEPSGVSVAVLDVTELRRAQAAAEAAELATARFLAAMNHEFRTPIGIVVGFADLLRKAAAERGLSRELVDHVSEIHAASGHLLSLVEDATRYAKIVQAGHEPARVVICTREVVSAAMHAAGAELRDAGVSIALPPSGDRGPEVAAHPYALRDGLAALLREIARRAPSGATVEVAWQTASSHTIQLEVRCTALVLPNEVLDRLRRPMEAADLHGRGLEGASFGLAVAEGAVRMHGGQLTAESVPGCGTCFCMELPKPERGRDRDRCA